MMPSSTFRLSFGGVAMVRFSVATTDMCELRGARQSSSLGTVKFSRLEAVACQAGISALKTRLAPIARESLSPARWRRPKTLRFANLAHDPTPSPSPFPSQDRPS
jgi:hypothetical protein